MKEKRENDVTKSIDSHHSKRVESRVFSLRFFIFFG